MLSVEELLATIQMEQACGPMRDPHDHPQPGNVLYPKDPSPPAESTPPNTSKVESPPDTPSSTT